MIALCYKSKKWPIREGHYNISERVSSFGEGLVALTIGFKSHRLLPWKRVNLYAQSLCFLECRFHVSTCITSFPSLCPPVHLSILFFVGDNIELRYLAGNCKVDGKSGCQTSIHICLILWNLALSLQAWWDIADLYGILCILDSNVI